jgi:hypothetical protein
MSLKLITDEVGLVGGNDPETHRRLALLRVAGEVLRQAVDDVAHGLASGLLGDEFVAQREPCGTRASAAQAIPSDMEVLDAADFLRDWRSNHLCDVLSTCAPRNPISPSFLRTLATRRSVSYSSRGGMANAKAEYWRRDVED